MFGLSLLLLALAVYFMTRQVRPILRLAWAMDKFGKGRDVGDFRLAGPTEIRRAGAAFNLMRKRILRHIGQRTEMLAAVSHDLRTPLTRMKLELEMLSEGRAAPGDLDDLRADVEEMARVVDGYLDFARGEGQESIEPIELGPFLQEIAERASTPDKRIVVELERPITLPLRPIAMRRCFTNLMQNAAALRHAASASARLATSDQVWIAVDDDGPGIPEERARRGVQAVLSPRCVAAAQHRRRRAGPDHRPRHRARPWRRDRAVRCAGGRAARADPAAQLTSRVAW